MSKKHLDSLINTIQKNNPHADLDLIRRAHTFAEEAHKGQFRFNGEPYLTHVVATAQFLADWHLSDTIIAAGILHDTPEDTKKTVKDIEREFGADIAAIVEGETKLGRAKHVGVTRYVENLRKLFLAMAKDVRVVFVKFADRLHNLSTIEALPPEKQLRTARESLEIYAPIAGRLGMAEIKAQIEDLSFSTVYPEEYEWTKKITAGKIEQKEVHIQHLKKTLEKKLKPAGIMSHQIYGRAKHLYSLYRKLLKHDRNLSRVYDLVALRVIVKDVTDCYATLGLIHNHWKPLPGRIKDYIAQPKPNGYRSLHTTVFDDDGEIVEIQIRTQEMHNEAEYGVAAHWRYQEDGKTAVPTRQVRWMEDLAKIQKEIEDKKSFLETLEELKIDLFQDRIFVSTPKGDILDLPEESTPVDFAYAIHTDIGDHCVGVQVNEQTVPLNSKLKSGDVVHILVDQKRKTPSGDWLKFVKTRHARQKIKASRKSHITDWFQSMLPKGVKEKKNKKRK
jgi:GTP diphosphokinase / guanosine-3',5'-bis(diphosphate) 3'-diphosphatase